MPHIPGHNVQYVIKETGEPYNGLFIKLNSGEIYTTTTGALEGNAHILVPADGKNITRDPGTDGPPPPSNINPVTQLFRAPTSPRYYRADGTPVNIGDPLHRHLNGTVMTEHSMGDTDNSVIVTTNSARRMSSTIPNVGRRTRTGRQETRTQQQNRMNQNQTTTRRTSTSTTSTRTGRMNPNRRTSGGSGGGGGY